MKPLLGILAALMTAGTAQAEPALASSVTVTRDGSTWTADYSLAASAPVWIFRKSVLPRESKESWRTGTVRVLSPGVRLERLGDYDALVSESGKPLPRAVRLGFTPFTDDIEAGYDAALRFSDGSVALYSDQFQLVPMPSAAAARSAPKNDDELRVEGPPTRVTMKDRAGPVLAFGERHEDLTMTGGGTYVLFGRAEPVDRPSITTILDPELPAWLKASLVSDLPAILARYESALGPSPMGKPTLMVSWQGADREGYSFGGSVLPGLVVMTLSGKEVLEKSPAIGNYARWFVAHEAAHFWLGQSVHYSEPAESWITEGGADLLAFRATAATVPGYDIRARLGRARDECAPFLANGGLAEAYKRSDDFRAYYACGAIFALAAEKASGGSFEDFVRALIARAGANKTVNRKMWLALLNERSRNPAISAAIADLLDRPHADGKAALDRFVEIAGVADQLPEVAAR